ncbi:hypothetical protein ACSHXN_46315 (plasmid) [Streptomyces sp. HUAS TT11]|uniref:hypothetical protein n=1 Tax=Streptomyces sp. HUAS TT11 TaxID=3447508 RepID=UPI003F656057
MSAPELFTGLVGRIGLSVLVGRDVHEAVGRGRRPGPASSGAWADIGASGVGGYRSRRDTLLRPQAVAA